MFHIWFIVKNGEFDHQKAINQEENRKPPIIWDISRDLPQYSRDIVDINTDIDHRKWK